MLLYHIKEVDRENVTDSETFDDYGIDDSDVQQVQETEKESLVKDIQVALNSQAPHLFAQAKFNRTKRYEDLL